MENGKRKQRRQLSPEEKWEVFLEVTSQELSQADAARKWNVDVSTVIIGSGSWPGTRRWRRSPRRSRAGCPRRSRSSWRLRLRRTIGFRRR